MGSINILKPRPTFLQPVPLINQSNYGNFSTEKNWKRWGSNSGLLDEEQVCYLCALQPHLSSNVFFPKAGLARLQQLFQGVWLSGCRQRPTSWPTAWPWTTSASVGSFWRSTVIWSTKATSAPATVPTTESPAHQGSVGHTLGNASQVFSKRLTLWKQKLWNFYKRVVASA